MTKFEFIRSILITICLVVSLVLMVYVFQEKPVNEKEIVAEQMFYLYSFAFYETESMYEKKRLDKTILHLKQIVGENCLSVQPDIKTDCANKHRFIVKYILKLEKLRDDWVELHKK